jgi:hypothetical protein
MGADDQNISPPGFLAPGTTLDADVQQITPPCAPRTVSQRTCNFAALLPTCVAPCTLQKQGGRKARCQHQDSGGPGVWAPRGRVQQHWALSIAQQQLGPDHTASASMRELAHHAHCASFPSFQTRGGGQKGQVVPAAP